MTIPPTLTRSPTTWIVRWEDTTSIPESVWPPRYANRSRTQTMWRTRRKSRHRCHPCLATAWSSPSQSKHWLNFFLAVFYSSQTCFRSYQGYLTMTFSNLFQISLFIEYLRSQKLFTKYMAYMTKFIKKYLVQSIIEKYFSVLWFLNIFSHYFSKKLSIKY